MEYAPGSTLNTAVFATAQVLLIWSTYAPGSTFYVSVFLIVQVPKTRQDLMSNRHTNRFSHDTQARKTQIITRNALVDSAFVVAPSNNTMYRNREHVMTREHPRLFECNVVVCVELASRAYPLQILKYCFSHGRSILPRMAMFSL